MPTPHTPCTHPPTAHTTYHTHLIYTHKSPCHTLAILHSAMHTTHFTILYAHLSHPLYTPHPLHTSSHTLHTPSHTPWKTLYTHTHCTHTPSHTTCKHTVPLYTLPHTPSHTLHIPSQTHYTHPHTTLGNTLSTHTTCKHTTPCTHSLTHTPCTHTTCKHVIPLYTPSHTLTHYRFLHTPSQGDCNWQVGVLWSVSMTRSWSDKECTMGGVYKGVYDKRCACI